METSTTKDNDLEIGRDISLRPLPRKHAPLETDGVLQNQAELIYYPEGGFAAWTVVFGAFCGLCGGVGP
jgi:hypothetical protein